MKKILFLFPLIIGINTAFAASFKLNTLVDTNQIHFNHTTIYVVDLKTSSDFYSQIIGLKSIPEPFHDGKHSWYAMGDHSRLHVVLGAKEKINHDINIHLAFSVKNLTEFIEHLKKSGVKFGDWAGNLGQSITRPDGVRQIYFQDPDGYWIEVNNDQD